ncbi:N-succinylarginine dihydrolase [Aliikangiella coralliicola]|uniref:N-succinylarginine dihydrolase n=1 Tax=Aliikangiella coralliicola TaxID=2592383 RepID=A0A545TWH7_9GAMM|nr:N-succinylarginine dihydrolase [Aliikangiella coralliicola]TQV81564.1 N-succinylarginine dihydrolase [Aliikangiella coralliicola]
MQAFEVNFDGLVGPTHNYAGLSVGNVASLKNADQASSPKQGALQGLAKMKALSDMGLKQAVLPPLERPDVYVLRQLGFTGSDAEVIKQAAEQAPAVYAATCSASSMWTANACTVSPSADAADGKVHFTAANLSNKFHRSIESPTTSRVLSAIFADEKYFAHHQPLPLGDHFGDEGAANHTRFCNAYNSAGVEFFVFGKYAFDNNKPAPVKYPARQTYEASQAIARLHQLNPNKTVYAQQHPDVIDAGVFHNDVISVGNQDCLFYHENAFLNTEQVLNDLQTAFGDQQLHFVKVPAEAVSVEDAVNSYLFNSQLVTLSPGHMAIIAPGECQENDNVRQYLEAVVAQDNPIKEVKIYDVKQSMRNGGGPACLRQRVVLNESEIAAANQSVFITDELYATLSAWVEKHYRDSLTEKDLADPQLLVESRTALDELTKILNLGSVYPFQL